MAILSCNDLGFMYEEQVALQGINFEVNSGDYLCIVGENGSGKSTLVKGLLRLKKATTGEVLLGEGLKESEIGYLPQQNAHQKDFPASIFEVVLSGKLNSLGGRLFYAKQEKEEAENQLKRMNLFELKNRSYQELSGGQQQRVLLARALCATKKMLLLDEPVSGLDPMATNELYSVIKSINVQDKITVIMVSHDIKAAVEYATHILHLGTKQLFFGTTKEYVASEIGKNFVGGGYDDI